MKLLWTKTNVKQLQRLSKLPTLYAFDYDGTLSQIVKTPSKAFLSETTLKLLKELSRYIPIAIISGRSLSDLKKRLRFWPSYLIGNHGAEGIPFQNKNLTRAKITTQKWLDELIKIESSEIKIENKTYSLSIHYRKAKNKTKSKKMILKHLNTLKPSPRLIFGKSVINVLPANLPHKGQAIEALMNKSRLKYALYIGDDDTDEDVFLLKKSNILTIRIGKKSDSSAKFFIRNQSEINLLLRRLVGFYR